MEDMQDMEGMKGLKEIHLEVLYPQTVWQFSPEKKVNDPTFEFFPSRGWPRRLSGLEHGTTLWLRPR